jgi:hypothetical protein
VLPGLDVHVFVIIQVGKLRPERDIQGEGQLQGRLRLVVGENGHGRGQEITGDEAGHGDNIIQFSVFGFQFSVKKDREVVFI